VGAVGAGLPPRAAADIGEALKAADDD